MKVSVITVTYNSAETIRDTIRSVLSQDHPDIEYIIIDGGSTDATMQIISEYRDKISTVISEKDEGLYDALNKGLRMATGEVSGILHSDDFYIDSQVISDYVRVFEKENCDAVYANLYYVDRSNTGRIKRKWHSGNYSPRAFYQGWMPPHPTFFVKTALYRSFGYFDCSFKTAADYELMLRFILKEGIRIAYLDKFTVKMRTGGKSNDTWKSRYLANLDDKRAWKKNGLRPGFLTLYLKPLRKILQFF